MAETNESGRGPGRALDLLVVGLPLALLYLRTGSRDLGTIDSGELATVCARFGVAHPTGYPLYVLLGRLAVLLWPGPPIVAVILFSTFVAVAAALIVTSLTREIASGSALPRWSPWAAGLWFGCDRVFWDQATGNEVYALHMLFVALLLRQGVRLLRAQAGPRDLFLTAWLLGLSFANHLSSSFLLPAMAAALAFYLARPRALRRSGPAGPRVLLACFGLVALAWSVVLVLPLRSAQQPILNWGETHEWGAFWRHAMAAQYRVWMFESGALWWTNLSTYLRSLPGRLWWPFLLLAPVGVVALHRLSPRRLLFLALAGLITMAWAASYDIHDIETYYLPADLALAVLAALGAGWCEERLRRGARAGETATRGGSARARRLSIALGAAAGVLAISQLALHFKENDRRDDHFIRAHAEMLLDELPPHAILLSRHWDALISPLLYLQAIEGRRRDVTVVDVELLRRSWDYAQLRRWDPTLFQPMEDRVAAFLKQARLFERQEPYDPATIERCYESVIEGIAQLHRPDRPTAFTPDVTANFLDHAAPIPEGLTFVLSDDPAAAAPLPPPDVERLLHAGYDPDDSIHRQVIEAWVKMISARIRYLEVYKRAGEIPPWQAALDRLRPFLRAEPESGPGVGGS